MATPEQVTQLLIDWKNGNREALDILTPLVYDELRRLADAYLRREAGGHTLQPTALVHEAYLRLAGSSLPDFESRSHFFGIAANLMRQVLVDHARKRASAKRGAGVEKLPIRPGLELARQPESALIALDDALIVLGQLDPRKVKIIELRFFGGLSVDETAQALSLSAATVGREQRLAEAWLHRELNQT
ncbi:MAG: sigma-70 family RNA polymerase sigma factor [Bryobacteraceae bacterium]|nr:sigma-70 family RNA polymerase sigma factor [Bryobacteraceae bacterium]